MKEYTTWVHAKDYMLATVDTETTGLRAGYNDMIQLAVLPLNTDLDPSGIEPFNLILKPARPQNIAAQAMKVNGITYEQLKHACEPEDAFFAFEKWYEKNVVGNGFRGLLPIGQNIQFDQGFIEDWAGWDSEDPTLNASSEFFRWRSSRDTKYVAEFMNDLAYAKNVKLPFPTTSLGRLAARFGISTEGAHDALADCIMTAKVYKRLTGLLVRAVEFGAVDE